MNELSTADRLEIGELISKYCHGVDRRQWDSFRDIFTDDCRLDLTQLLGLYEGRDGIAKFIEIIDSLPITMRHLTTNTVLSGGGDTAHAESYVLAITGAPGNMNQMTGFYEDELVKRDGRWRLRSRRLMADTPKK
jgi:ketosteroid isomerase-like protein